jgi:hypothetical protein
MMEKDAKTYQHHPDYDQLPEVLRHMVSPEEYAWMGNQGRKQLVDDICYPDWEED